MQSVAHVFTFFNPRMSLAVAFSVLSVYVNVCNKCLTCLWEVVYSKGALWATSGR